ncbi:MAG TPA: hypothetical protein PK228_13890 [Saprospiraceae bacterium]|nr:hypothetical protein [Saprospiraceae bacterium]
MKTTSKSIGLLFGAALLFSACGQDAQNPPAELAALSIYEFTHHQPVHVAGQNLTRATSANKHDRSITDFLTDCESQLDRIRDGFSASIGQPHRMAFPR